MEVVITHIDEFEKEMDIIVPWGMIESDYNDLLKKYAKLPVKGFRPGKTPPGATEAYYKGRIKDDLLILVSTRLCRKALKEKEIIAGTPVEITKSEVKKNENLRFNANFIVMPSFELPDYKKLDLQSTETNENLDEISEKLLELTKLSLHPLFIENELKYSETEEDVFSDDEKEAAANRVKLMLILKAIANQNNIEIDERDIEERIKIIAEENEVTPEELKKFFMENGGTARLSDSLLAEQVLQYIISIQE